MTNNTAVIATKQDDTVIAASKALMYSFLAAAVCIMLASPALAGPADTLATAIANLKIDAINVAGPLATIAIIALGVGAMFGRITWNQALVVAIGIIIAVKADTVYSSIVGR